MRNLNERMAHDYFYDGVGRGLSKKYACRELSFRGDTAISYKTAIAVTVPCRGYDRADPTVTDSGLCILSFPKMSSYTGRHIAAIREASPFKHVYAPMTRGRSSYGPRDMRKMFLSELKRLSAILHRAGAAVRFISLMENRRDIVNLATEKWAYQLRSKKLFGKYEKIEEGLHDYVEKLKEKRKKDAAKKARAKREFLKKFSGSTGRELNELYQSVYDDSCNPLGMSTKKRNEAKAILGCRHYCCWLTYDEVRTNHGVSIPVKEVRAALKAWVDGKDMHAQKIGRRYTVISYTGDIVKIGCHNFDMRNIIALYEVVMNEPFPGVKARNGKDYGCGQ